MVVILMYSFCHIIISKTCLTSLLLKDYFQIFNNHPASTYNFFTEWLHGFYREHIYLHNADVREESINISLQ